jgi:hypothetical protein
MATCSCRCKWCINNDEHVLQDNVLPRITCVAIRIMLQHQKVVATCTIATPKVWLLYGAALLHHITSVTTDLCGNTKKWWQHVQLLRSYCRCYKTTSITSHKECGNKNYTATPRNGGNIRNYHVRIVVAIRCILYYYANCSLLCYRIYCYRKYNCQ